MTDITPETVRKVVEEVFREVLGNQPPAPAHPGLKNRIPKAMRSARRSPGLVRSLFHHPPAVHAA